MSVTELPVKPPRPPRESRALHKGQQTKAAIVDAALGLATQIGLEGLSIGALAEVTQMSKSGVFAHFGSREELQTRSSANTTRASRKRSSIPRCRSRAACRACAPCSRTG